MRQIPLSQGKVALVDDVDFEFLSQWKWCAANNGHGTWYATRLERKSEVGLVGKRRKIYMHRVIVNVPDGMEVDHRDSNGLNNQRYNIRIGTQSQNNMNRVVDRKSTSGYKGVSFDIRAKRWQAGIKVDKVRKNLGLFDTKEDAARAYNKEASVLFGEFARLNEVNE